MSDTRAKIPFKNKNSAVMFDNCRVWYDTCIVIVGNKNLTKGVDSIMDMIKFVQDNQEFIVDCQNIEKAVNEQTPYWSKFLLINEQASISCIRELPSHIAGNEKATYNEMLEDAKNIGGMLGIEVIETTDAGIVYSGEDQKYKYQMTGFYKPDHIGFSINVTKKD